jgi:hypothetical protein
MTAVSSTSTRTSRLSTLVSSPTLSVLVLAQTGHHYTMPSSRRLKFFSEVSLNPWPRGVIVESVPASKVSKVGEDAASDLTSKSIASFPH